MATGRYLRRVLDEELDVLLKDLPAVALEGAKAVGKTSTAVQRASVIYQLDDAAQRDVLEADIDRLVAGSEPLLIDEWQYLPASWDRVRRAVDEGAPPGRFLLTGSAAPAETGTHTGSARIVSLRMRPFSLAERLSQPSTVSLSELLTGERPDVEGRSTLSLSDYVSEILQSGFPGLRHLSGRPLRAQLDGYIQRVVDRDFPEFGHSLRNPMALRRWMAAYAAATATTARFETVRDAATSGEGRKPSKAATAPYRDVLQRLFIIDPVPAWTPSRSHIAELALPPKHHLADPALAARLVGATASSLLRGESPGPPIPRDGTFLGALFESLVTLSVRVYAQAADAAVAHFRTYRGDHEADLMVERDDGRVVAMEVKLGQTADADAVRHLVWLADRLGDGLLDAVVVTTGKEAFRRSDGIAVVPAALLGP